MSNFEYLLKINLLSISGKSFKWNRPTFLYHILSGISNYLQKCKLLGLLVFKESLKFEIQICMTKFQNVLITELENWYFMWMILVHPMNHKLYWMNCFPSSFYTPPHQKISNNGDYPKPLSKISNNGVRSVNFGVNETRGPHKP